MPNMLGGDYSPLQPSDDDLVKHGAREIRTVKQVLVDFMRVLFNLETGDLRDNIVRSGALKDITPAISAGPWNSVTVNAKGQVVAGDNVEALVSANINRFYFTEAGGLDPDGVVLAPNEGGGPQFDEDGKEVVSYTFTIPEGVSRVLVRVQGAGGGASQGVDDTTQAASGAGGGYGEAILIVAEGDPWRVDIGLGGQAQVTSEPATAAQAGSTTVVYHDAALFVRAPGGHPGLGTAPGGAQTPSYSGIGGMLAWSGGSGNLSVAGVAEGGAAADGSPRLNAGWGGNVSGYVGMAGHSGYVIVEYWL